MSPLTNNETVRLVRRVCKLEREGKALRQQIVVLAESNQMLIDALQESDEVQQLLFKATVCGPSDRDPERGPAVRALRQHFKDKARD